MRWVVSYSSLRLTTTKINSVALLVHASLGLALPEHAQWAAVEFYMGGMHNRRPAGRIRP